MAVTDRKLLEQVLRGDTEAYRPLVEEYTPTLFRVAYRITNSRSDAEEVVQEAFLRAYQQLPRFELRSDFATWLYRICVNCALNRLQKERITRLRTVQADPERGEWTLPDREATPEQWTLNRQMAARREEAMKSLTEVERAAFVLRHLEERSTEEIADVLGMTANAAKQAVFRSVQKLRRALEPLWVKG